ncbi:MAG: phasin family protein [Rhodomicrobium sp.]
MVGQVVLIFVIEQLGQGRAILPRPSPPEEFMADTPFEIPQQMRDLADQNIKQAHAAYEQLTDFVTKAVGAWMGAIPSPMAAGFKDFQDSAAEIAKKNAESAFALIEKMAKAQNIQEVLTLQTQFAQDQMKAFTTQTQELHKLIGETVQKVQRG